MDEAGSSSLGKRRRLDAEDQKTTRSEAIWFDDGNIILAAETVYFRCHRGILARHSLVFADMFTVGSSSAGDEVFDGCPIIQLYDTAQEVEFFLRAIYDVKSRASIFPISLAVVTAMLKLGKKYQVQFIEDDAVARLTSVCPSTLSGFHAYPPSRAELLIEHERAHFLDVITLVRESDLVYLLPGAFFIAASRLTVEETYGIRRRDGSLATLSAADHQVLLRGIFAARTAVKKYCHSWLRSNGVDPARPDLVCLTSTTAAPQNSQRRERLNGMHRDVLEPATLECQRSRMQLLAHWYDMDDEEKHLLRLHSWSTNSSSNPSSLPKPTNFCKHCIRLSTVSYDNGRNKVWINVPSFFGLPSWNELAVMRNPPAAGPAGPNP